MAIRDWHAGQLVVLWLGVILGSFFLVFLADLAISGDFSNVSAVELILAMLLLGSPLIIAGLVVTWKWFGGRPNKS